jgi:CDP-2,3-bis-(O-geranylgeranyl)-sn-glycerol synthase
MSHLILSALYFLLPAYVANMCPVFAGALRLPLGGPMSTRLFGSHKTYRGLYAAFMGALGIVWLQRTFQTQGILEGWRLIDYSSENLFLLALLFGMGAAGGDLVKSFCKRSFGVEEGRPWFPFDQLDLVIGALVLVSPVYLLDVRRILVLLILTPLLHFLTNVIGYHLGLKDVWW